MFLEVLVTFYNNGIKFWHIRKQGKISPDPVYLAESPPDRPNLNQMDARSAILHWIIDPESVSSEKKYNDGRENFRMDSAGDNFWPNQF